MVISLSEEEYGVVRPSIYYEKYVEKLDGGTMELMTKKGPRDQKKGPEKGPSRWGLPFTT